MTNAPDRVLVFAKDWIAKPRFIPMGDTEYVRADLFDTRIRELEALLDDTTSLHRVMADIREASGVGSRPMLSEMAEAIKNRAWDDETCLRFAEGFDREDAAHRGEPNPHDDKQSDDYAEWAADRIACVRAGLASAFAK